MTRSHSLSSGKPPKWSALASAVGINLEKDLGDIMKHILHYVDCHGPQGRRTTGAVEMVLDPKKLASSILKKREAKGVSLRGASERSVRRAIDRLVDLGLLLIVGVNPNGARLFMAGWAPELEQSPKLVWHMAASVIQSRSAARAMDQLQRRKRKNACDCEAES